MWESALSINKIKEIRGRTSIVIGQGAIKNTYDVIKAIRKEEPFNRIIVVAGKSAYKKTGAWAHVEKALIKHQIHYVVFDKISPNPTTEEVDEAVLIARELHANGVIGIGGGSAIDAAKSVAIMALYSNFKTEQLFTSEFEPKKALSILAINTTHGTGSEANRFAVMSIPNKHFKFGIGYDFLYPQYAINDPELMTSLSKEQTAYTSIDAVNHVIEACTSFLSNPLVHLLAKEVIRLVDKYLPVALNDGKNVEARYCLSYAASIAGMSFDNSTLHLTHALEHPLSAIKPDLPHGLGLAVLLPAVIHKIYPKKSEVLADILSPILPKLKGIPEEAEMASKGIKNWVQKMGVNQTLESFGLKEDNIDDLIELVYKTPGNALLLYCSPVPVDKKLIEDVYRASL